MRLAAPLGSLLLASRLLGCASAPAPAPTPAPALPVASAPEPPAPSASAAYVPYTPPLDPDDPLTCHQDYSRPRPSGTVFEWKADPGGEEALTPGLLLVYDHGAVTESGSHRMTAWLWRDGRLYVRDQDHTYDPRTTAPMFPDCRLTPAQIEQTEAALTAPLVLRPPASLRGDETRFPEVASFFDLPHRVGHLTMVDRDGPHCFSDPGLTRRRGPAKHGWRTGLSARVGARVHHVSIHEAGDLDPTIERLIAPLRTCKVFNRHAPGAYSD